MPQSLSIILSLASAAVVFGLLLYKKRNSCLP